MLLGTPFHSRVTALCQSHEWQRWNGYLTAAAYAQNNHWEYHAIRSTAGLLDVSPLSKYRIGGRDAERLLNRVVTRDVSRCKVDQVLYTPWCDADGKVIDDGTLKRFGPDIFRLTAAGPNLHWLRENAFMMDVDIQDVSSDVAALALQGPQSRSVLERFLGQPGLLDSLGYFRMQTLEHKGRQLTISRTGFTGDLGYEIWLDPEHAEQTWDELMQAGFDFQLAPVGMHALGVTRIEAGLILIGVDYISSFHALTESQKSLPHEIGLGWAVSSKKGSYSGKRALMAEKQSSPKWQFIGFEIDWPSVEKLYRAAGLNAQVPAQATRSSIPLYDQDR